MKEITKIKICNNLILIFFYNKIIPILKLLAQECSTYSLKSKYNKLFQCKLKLTNFWKHLITHKLFKK